MCGIVGYVGKQKAAAVILEGLKRLVCALARRRSCSRMGWDLFRAERESNCEFDGNCKFNNNGKFNGNYDGGGDGEPDGVEGAASWIGGVRGGDIWREGPAAGLACAEGGRAVGAGQGDGRR